MNTLTPKPLVIQSYNRPVTYKNKVYKRRLRISPFTAIRLDEALQKQNIHIYSQYTKYVAIDGKEDIKTICKLLDIEYKSEYLIYFYVDDNTQSIKSGVDNQY